MQLQQDTGTYLHGQSISRGRTHTPLLLQVTSFFAAPHLESGLKCIRDTLTMPRCMQSKRTTSSTTSQLKLIPYTLVISEESCGAAIKELNVKREDLFITTKVREVNPYLLARFLT